MLTAPPPPGLLELISGPFRGFAIYRRAADIGPWRALGLLLFALLVAGSIKGAVEMRRIAANIDAMEDSAISFMPRVNIDGGYASVEAAPGRIIETDRIVILFDTREEPDEVPKAVGDDTRPRVLVGDRALLRYSPDRPVPLALPWSQLNAALGPRLSVDGREFIELLRSIRGPTVLTLGAIITLLVLVWELLLLGVMTGMYRLLFGRRIGAPPAGRVFAVACLATLPAVAFGMLILLVTDRQEWALLGHGAVLGGLVLLGGNSLVGLAPKASPLGDAPPAVATEL